MNYAIIAWWPSDSQEKTQVAALSEAELRAAKRLASEIGTFQFLASVEAKGEAGARRHVGMTVQRAIEIMEAEGLNPYRYAFICRDDLPEGGERYGFRTDQLALFIARGMEARLAALEAR